MEEEEMSSLKKNIFYSVLLVVANYVFPFLTYPYVSRVLGVTGIGACNFVDSIINYFILFSSLGIQSLGVREIAKHKDDKEALDRTFSNLFIVNLALTGIMLLLLFVVTFTVPQLSAHKDLMCIGAFKLVFNCLLVEWLFRGLDDFKLITVRSIVVKTVYVAAVFLFVRKAEDVWVYYLLSSLMVVANALINIVLSRSRVLLHLRGLQFSATFKSLLALGVYSILTSMYTTFNVTFLGFACGETEVGYYTTATKIYFMVMAVFSAFTNVMLPRMSNLVSRGEMDQFKSSFSMAVEVLFGFSFPIIVWMMLMAPDIVRVISGPGYEGAVIPMIIIAPLLFIVGFEQILVLQTLLPLGRDKLLLRNSLIGAGIGVVLNLALVPILASGGSSIVWIVAEMTILVLSQVAVRRELDIRFPLSSFMKNLAVYLPLVAIVALTLLISGEAWRRVVVSMFCVGIYVLIYQIVIRKGAVLSMLK